jgi:hypothetical protein
MNEGFIKNSVETVLKEAQTILTLSYVFMVGIGMLFTYYKYHYFGINIFNYATVFDFLIAPFGDIKILAFTIISTVLAFVFYFLDLFWRKKFPVTYKKLNRGWDEKPWYPAYKFGMFGVLVIYYVFIGAMAYGKWSKKSILKQADITIIYADGHVYTGKNIGQTGSTIFMIKDKQVSAIPLNALIREVKL